MLRALLAVVLTLSTAAHAQAPRTASDPEARTRWLATVDEIQRWRDTDWPEDAIANGRFTPCPDRITDSSIRRIYKRSAQ